MSPTLHQAEPPRRAAEDSGDYKTCDVGFSDGTATRLPRRESRIPRTSRAFSEGRRKRIEAFETREQQNGIGDAEHRDHHVHDATHRATAPPKHRIVQAHREHDHPRDDSEAEHGDAEEDPAEGGHSERDDEEDQEFIVAREAVNDPDREHRLVFPVFREMPMEPRVKMSVLHETMPMLVHVEQVELPEQPDDSDKEQHDRDEEIEMSEEVGEDGLAQRVQEDGDDLG